MDKWLLFFLPVCAVYLFFSYRAATKQSREENNNYIYSRFWERCSEKKAKKAIADICSNPNLDLKTFRTISSLSSDLSTPLISAAKGNNCAVVRLLIAHNLNPFQRVRDEDCEGKPFYDYAALYAYVKYPGREELRSIMDEYKSRHPKCEQQCPLL